MTEQKLSSKPFTAASLMKLRSGQCLKISDRDLGVKGEVKLNDKLSSMRLTPLYGERSLEVTFRHKIHPALDSPGHHGEDTTLQGGLDVREVGFQPSLRLLT